MDYEKVREALRRAARLVPADVVTVISEHGDEAAARHAKPIFKAEQPKATEDTNPEPHLELASLLGYGDDEEEEKEDEKKENPGIETDSKPNASHQAAPEPPGDCNGSKETTDDDPMDQELANFMSELESSGLLKDDDTAMGHASADAATTAPAAINQDLHGQKATAGLQTPSIAVDAAAAATADVEMAQGDGGDSGEAEQRVLGYLKAAPEWSTVKDMGSQQVYYWNLSTNEVVWEVPDGMDPDDVIPPDDSAPADDGTADKGADAAAPQAEDGSGNSGPGVAVGSGGDGSGGPAKLAEAEAAQGGRQGPPLAPTPGTQATPASLPGGGGDKGQGATPPGSDPEGGGTGPGAAQSCDGGTPTSLGAVLERVRSQAHAAARYFLQSMPAVVRLAVEADVRLSDWRAVTGALRGAESDAGGGGEWEVRYVKHVLGHVADMQGAMAAAMAEAEAMRGQGRPQAAAGGTCADGAGQEGGAGGEEVQGTEPKVVTETASGSEEHFRLKQQQQQQQEGQQKPRQQEGQQQEREGSQQVPGAGTKVEEVEEAEEGELPADDAEGGDVGGGSTRPPSATATTTTTAASAAPAGKTPHSRVAASQPPNTAAAAASAVQTVAGGTVKHQTASAAHTFPFHPTGPSTGASDTAPYPVYPPLPPLTAAAADPYTYSWPAHAAYQHAYHPHTPYPPYPYSAGYDPTHQYESQGGAAAEGKTQGGQENGPPLPPSPPPPPPPPQDSGGRGGGGGQGEAPPLPPLPPSPSPSSDGDDMDMDMDDDSDQAGVHGGSSAAAPSTSSIHPQTALQRTPTPPMPPLPHEPVGFDPYAAAAAAAAYASAAAGYQHGMEAAALAAWHGSNPGFPPASSSIMGPLHPALEFASAAVAHLPSSAPPPKRREYSAAPVRTHTPTPPQTVQEAAPGAAEAGWTAAGGSTGAPTSAGPPSVSAAPKAAPAHAVAAGAHAEKREEKRRAGSASGASSGAAKKAKLGASGVGSKGIGALMSHWGEVQRKLAKEEEEAARKAEEAADPEAQERKRVQELEKWRHSQEADEAVAEVNANFAPVQGNWKDVLAKLKKEERKKEKKEKKDKKEKKEKRVKK